MIPMGDKQIGNGQMINFVALCRSHREELLFTLLTLAKPAIGMLPSLDDGGRRRGSLDD